MITRRPRNKPAEPAHLRSDAGKIVGESIATTLNP